LIEDIDRFKNDNGCDRLVAVWCGSTEAYQEPSEVHETLAAFEQGLRDSDDNISPSQIYAYALISSGVPLANGAPNLSVDIPAMIELAEARGVPIAGKDFKTGQTLMKTILAPGFKARMLGLRGWYSTNILGNRDGEVLDDPESFRTKEESKLGVLEEVLEPDRYPQLYGDVYHKVRINYYPPRGDNKEGWDNVDLFGWLGYPMQLKIDFMCRDSILAAPLALDLCLFLDLARRAGLGGIQEWLSFYFKSPQVAPGLYPEHDLFIQQTKLRNTLRWMMGEEPITHLGMDYYLDE
jgi:myo-inositol-1-phosphate synthase